MEHELRKQALLKPDSLMKSTSGNEECREAKKFDLLYTKKGLLVEGADKPANEETLLQVRRLEWSNHVLKNLDRFYGMQMLRRARIQ